MRIVRINEDIVVYAVKMRLKNKDLVFFSYMLCRFHFQVPDPHAGAM